MPTPKQRKMTKINIAETSGVDHPAHLHEGWMIRKGANPATVNKLFGLPDTSEEGANVPEINKEAEGQNAELTAEELEKAGKNTPASKDDIIAALQAELKAAKAGKVTKSEDESEADKLAALAKSAELPEAVRSALEKQATDLRKAETDMAKAREELQKERDERLDEQAVAKSKEIYKAVSIEHDTVAPALRRVAVIDAELAKSVETALKAADAQLTTAGLFKEAGTTGGTGTAESQLMAKAEALLAEGKATNLSSAIAKAATDDPSLYEAIQAEKAGK